VLAGADATFGGLASAATNFDRALRRRGHTATGTPQPPRSAAATALLTFSTSATGSFGAINLATPPPVRSVQHPERRSVTANSLLMVDDSLARIRTLTSMAQVRPSRSTGRHDDVGAASLSTASVNVQSSGTINTGTALHTDATGGISITGASSTRTETSRSMAAISEGCAVSSCRLRKTS